MDSMASMVMIIYVERCLRGWHQLVWCFLSKFQALWVSRLTSKYHLLAQHCSLTDLITSVTKSNSYLMTAADLSVLRGFHVREGYVLSALFHQFHVHETLRISYCSDFISDDHIENTGAIKRTGNAAISGQAGLPLCIDVSVRVNWHSMSELWYPVNLIDLCTALSTLAIVWFTFLFL